MHWIRRRCISCGRVKKTAALTGYCWECSRYPVVRFPISNYPPRNGEGKIIRAVRHDVT